MGGLRKELLQLVMKRLDRISRDAATSGKADRTMGVALQRMGLFYNMMGMTEKEKEVYQQSLEIFGRLIRDYPDEDWNRFNAAISYDSLGEIARETEPDPDKLFEPYLKSLDLRKNLVKQVRQAEPTLIRRYRALATTHIKIAILALMVGDPAQAHGHALEGLRVNNEIKAANIEEKARQDEALATAYLTLAKANLRLGSEVDARESLNKSLRLWEDQVKADDTNAHAKQELGRALAAHGDLEMELGHTPAAVTNYQRALALFEKLVQKDPTNAELRWYVANVRYVLGTARRSLDHAAARADYEACLKTRRELLKDDPKNPQRKIELMLVLARLGQHPEATALATEIRSFAPRHPGMLYACACAYALSLPALKEPAQRRVYLEKAASALEQAIRNGYRDRRGMEADPDLEPFRSFPAYRQVVELVPIPRTERGQLP